MSAGTNANKGQRPEVNLATDGRDLRAALAP